jgi:hypothetical protein
MTRTKKNLLRRLVCLAATAIVHLTSVAEPIEVVWQPKEVSFTYVNDNVAHECKQLEDQVVEILRRLGAVAGTYVRSGCQRAAMMTLHITTAVPAPIGERATTAVSENINDQALTKRFGNAGAPDAKPFSAEWQEVTLTTKEFDCELLRRMSTLLLEPLGVKIVRPIGVCPKFSTIAVRPARLVASALIAKAAH